MQQSTLQPKQYLIFGSHVLFSIFGKFLVDKTCNLLVQGQNSHKQQDNNYKQNHDSNQGQSQFEFYQHHIPFSSRLHQNCIQKNWLILKTFHLYVLKVKITKFEIIFINSLANFHLETRL